MKKKFSVGSFKFALIIFVSLFLFSNIILAFSSGGFILNVKEIGFSAFSTIQSGVNSAGHGIKTFFTSIKELADLKKEYQVLVEKLSDYEYMQRDNALIRAENEKLKEQLAISENISVKNYSARIVGRDYDSVYSSITINKGSYDGIRKNMSVVAVQNGTVGLVGKIVSVGPFTSLIMPIYDSQFNVSARISHTGNVGLVSGLGNLNKSAKMQYVKKIYKDDFQYGDVVVTSGENGNYLENILIGTISNVQDFDYDSFLQIDILPIIDFDKLSTVLVVDTKSERE